MALLDSYDSDRAHLGGGADVYERWGSGMTDWREELIEQMAKAAWESDGAGCRWEIVVQESVRNEWLREARAALAVAEPVIREQCAKKCEGDFDSEMKGYGAYFAAAIRDSRNCVPEGGKG